MKSSVLQDLTPCSLAEVYRRFGLTYSTFPTANILLSDSAQHSRLDYFSTKLHGISLHSHSRYSLIPRVPNECSRAMYSKMSPALTRTKHGSHKADSFMPEEIYVAPVVTRCFCTGPFYIHNHVTATGHFRLSHEVLPTSEA
jgi:hypothetical protein